MEYFKNLIEKLTTPMSECVGVCISSDSTLEVILYNKDSGQVKKFEKTELSYDNVLRQVDPAEFEASLLLLINKMDIAPNYPFFVALPNILTSVKTLPSDLEDIELEVALNSEAEKSYIFKKTDPKPSWILISSNEQSLTNTYLYSIIQKDQIANIQQVFAKNNLKLHAIDTSFAALIRGFSISGVLDENIENNSNWAIVTISHINYIIAKFQGAQLLNIIETPLALKSIEAEVLYSSIGAAVSEKLGKETLDNLYLVSQASDFTAEKLKNNIKIICNVHTVDNNKFQGKPIFLSQLSTELSSPSPESVGTACWQSAGININFNFTEADTKNEIQGILGNIGIKKALHLYLFIGIISSTVFITIFSLIFWGINSYLEAQVKKSIIEVKKMKELDVKPQKKFNLDRFMAEAYEANLKLVTSYDAAGATIPEKIWLESFFVDSEMNTVISGKSYTIEDIIIYYENLQKMAKFKKLRIKSINASSGAPDISNNSGGEEGLPLPPPPMPGEEDDVGTKKYYRFIFEDLKKSDKNDTFLDNLPESVRKFFGN